MKRLSARRDWVRQCLSSVTVRPRVAETAQASGAVDILLVFCSCWLVVVYVLIAGDHVYIVCAYFSFSCLDSCHDNFLIVMDSRVTTFIHQDILFSHFIISFAHPSHPVRPQFCRRQFPSAPACDHLQQLSTSYVAADLTRPVFFHDQLYQFYIPHCRIISDWRFAAIARSFQLDQLIANGQICWLTEPG